MAAAFAALYWYIPCAVVPAGGSCTDIADVSFLEIFAFSVITQSTLGYGNFVPEGSVGYLITILQLVVGITFSAIFAGFIVVRALTPSPNSLLCSDYVVFDPDSGQYFFRLMNTLSMPLFAVDLKLLGIRLIQGAGVFNRKPIPLMVEQLSYLEPHVPTFVRTRKSEPRPLHEASGSTIKVLELPELTPQTMGSLLTDSGRNYSEIRELRLVVSAETAVGNLNHLVTFPRSQIICGKHSNTWDEVNEKFDFKQFNEINRTKIPSRCETCVFDDGCVFKGAFGHDNQQTD